MKKIILILMFVFSSLVYSENSFVIAIDGAFFKHDEQNLRWEFYYSFPDYTMKYIKTGDIFSGTAKLKIDIYSNNIVYQTLNWTVTNQIHTLADTNLISLFGIKNFILAPGQYKVKFIVSDMNDSTKYSQTEFNLIAPKFNKSNITIGGITLASYMLDTDSSKVQYDDMFLRFNKYLFPNPSLEVYGDKSRILAYAEIYDAMTYAKDGLKITYMINDAVNNKMWSQSKQVIPYDDFMTEYLDIIVDSLHTGAYYLGIKLSYPIDKPIDSTSIFKKIYVINPSLKPLTRKYFTESQLYEKSVFSAMTPGEIDKQIKMARIISNPFEIAQIDLLSEFEAKKRFLFKFWLEKDPDTTTYVNEKYKEFMHNVEYATNFMSFTVGDGWQTERGKVILRYGIPTERNQFPEQMNNRPYEIWFYENVQGGVYFYFVDKTYSGNFWLVNSTARHEPNDPNWYNNYVLPTGSKSGSHDGIFPNTPNR
ncbi:MAG TPA: GWxTD domain-containing protein [Candidatus Kapabacteria bacterium]|nr:GWxTD domain-containing protein [Candidatus Kapabacteria bacterium]